MVADRKHSMSLFGLGKKKEVKKQSCCCGCNCTPENMQEYSFYGSTYLDNDISDDDKGGF